MPGWDATLARSRFGIFTAALVFAGVVACGPVGWARGLDGFNVIAIPQHPYGSPTALAALKAAKAVGAKAIAVVPFLWQRDRRRGEIARGDDMPDAELQLAVRQAHAVGLKVIVKPHVWVQGSWAGGVEPQSPDDWAEWFVRYRAALTRIAKVAASEGAEALCIGTELKKTTQRQEWLGIIAAVRTIFPGLLTYAAHNVEEAEAVPFWRQLDAIGVTLYPPLGDDHDRVGRLAAMRAVAARLDRLASREGKPIVVAEIGLRSARGAAKKPWESAEERVADPDPRLQAAVLTDWLAVLDRPTVSGVLIWRWFTDPRAGGPADTDFTVQGKPAENVLACARAQTCRN